VTAHLAVADAARVRVTFADGETTEAKIIGSDSSSDVR
jgi:S1-C subfamily serine protease